MLAVLGVAAPAFAVMALGWLAARRGWIDRPGLRGIELFVFSIAAPALLFAAGTAGHSAGGATALAFFLAVFSLYAAILLVAWRAGWPLSRSGPMALDGVYGNTVMMGIPLVFAAFGQPGLSVLMVILALHALLLLTIGTILAEIAAHGGGRPWPVARSALIGVLRNPIAMAVLAALLVAAAGIELPPVLRRMLELLGAATPGAALFLLGASLTGFALRAAWRQLALTLLVKLLLLPALVYALGWLLGLSRLELAVATLTAALPTGANAFLMASRYRSGMAESGAAVLASTLLSVLTLPLVLLLLGAG
ncbi:MAG: AEC family transporter [Rhodovarius sp.]|nr:AEC family transporter [Rhodovarius sp.]